MYQLFEWKQQLLEATPYPLIYGCVWRQMHSCDLMRKQLPLHHQSVADVFLKASHSVDCAKTVASMPVLSIAEENVFNIYGYKSPTLVFHMQNIFNMLHG